jgi:electron transport complex protein RnfC
MGFSDVFRYAGTRQTTGGLKIRHHKDTANFPTEYLPIPEMVVLSMVQHTGAACVPCVNKGDHVYVGTMVGKAPSAMSMHIFSSVSGTVSSIEHIWHRGQSGETIVIIKTDGLQEPDPSIKPPEVHDFESFVEALSMSGIVGLGGAGFPTDIKVQPKNLPDIDTLLINGAECEPYLTTDNREFLEHPDTILYGIDACLKYLDIPKCLICIEDNKPAAIDLMTKKAARDDRIDVCVLPSRYPQGAQNILIKNATGRIVPRGARHTVVGVIMLNVTTVSSIGKYLMTGMPLVNKRLTVAGDAIENPKNLEVPIGTQIKEVIKYCGITEEPQKIILGGPMMGVAQLRTEYPIVRQNNGVLAFGEKLSQVPEITPCIHCGRCVSACPMGLSPVEIGMAYERYEYDKFDGLMADICIGCGCCSYVCPAKRPLTEVMTLSKGIMKKLGKGGKK